MRVVLICGPWGSGTSAVAGLTVGLGALAFDRVFHFMTSDPRTPDSFEFIPFREVVLRHVDEASVAFKPTAPETVQASLDRLQQQIVRQEFGRYDISRDPWIALKHPLSALLIRKICDTFETRLIYVMRSLEQIEQTRRRRRWPANFGAEGAEVIYKHMEDARARRANQTLVVNYNELLASPMDHARRIARFVGLKPSLAQMKQAAAFVSRKG